MDDRIIHDPAGSILVAGMVGRLDRVRPCRPIYRHECSTWSNLPHNFPSSLEDKLWDIGQSVVCLQSRSYGVVRHLQIGRNCQDDESCSVKYLVRCPSKYRRQLCVGDAKSNVAEREQHS